MIFVNSGVGVFLNSPMTLSARAFCASDMLLNMGEFDLSPIVYWVGGLTPVTGDVLPVQLTISKSPSVRVGTLLVGGREGRGVLRLLTEGRAAAANAIYRFCSSVGDDGRVLLLIAVYTILYEYYFTDLHYLLVRADVRRDLCDLRDVIVFFFLHNP